MQWSRRQFLHGTTASLLAFGTGATQSVADAPDDDLPIVDTHQHLWDLAKLQPPWLKPGGELTRSYTMADYLEATAGLNVIKAVYMEVAVADDQLVKEANLVLDLCAAPDNPTCAAVIGGRPARDDLADYLDRFRGNPYLKGIRHIIHSADVLQSDDLVAGLRLLGNRRLRFDLCVSPPLLATGAKLLDRCPDTRFVLDHCGNADPKQFRRDASEADRCAADQWRRDIDSIAEREHVICKISGIVARMPKGQWTPDDLAPVINHCLDRFGPDRVVFASDWPVCTRGATFRQWVAALKEIVRGRPREEQRKLFCDNAVRFYELT